MSFRPSPEEGETAPSGRRVFIAIGCVLFSPLSQANSSLGEVNIELRGNVVDFTCAVVAG
ncbi:hypothetical protein MJO10_30120, partial [Salmonella enterica subsp. enterica serovar Anatum]|nr:hypothetical protein [Salmonella enterica subsp. enterica serovar Anatum]